MNKYIFIGLMSASISWNDAQPIFSMMLTIEAILVNLLVL